MKSLNKIFLSVLIITCCLTGCGEKDLTVCFKTVEECIVSQKFPPDVCEDQYKEALLASHEEIKFQSSLACLTSYSECKMVENDASEPVFVPVMAGFMISRAMGSSQSIHIESAPYWGDVREQEELQGKGSDELKPKALYCTKNNEDSFRTAADHEVGLISESGKYKRLESRD